MLTLYDYLQTSIEKHNQQQWFAESKLNYFASEIMQTLAIDDADEIAISINRAFEACSILHIPFQQNFKRVYCYDGQNLLMDWKISSLACYLIVINCNPNRESVAKAQLYFAMNNLTPK